MQEIQARDITYGKVPRISWEDFMAVDKGSHLEDDFS